MKGARWRCPGSPGRNERRAFFETRAALAESEREKLCARLGAEYAPYMPPPVFTAGEAQALSAPRERLRETAYCYPHLFARADIDFDAFLQTINANHLHAVYGQAAGTVRQLCGMLGIPFLSVIPIPNKFCKNLADLFSPGGGVFQSA